MKNTVRVRKNGATKPVSLQTKTPRTPAQNPSASPATAAPETIIPAQVAADAELAITNLERTGNAAVAFAMMNGYAIQQGSKDSRGWETLAVPGFSDGALELARIASTDFTRVCGELAGALKIMVTVCRGIHQPVKISPDYPTKHNLLLQVDPNNSWHRIESVTEALLHCITLQSWAMCCASTGHEQAGGFEISRNLEAVEKSIDQPTIKLIEAYCAVMASREVVS